MSWNAEQYLRFGGHRLRPVLDLIAAIDLLAPKRVVDLGCGPGNATIMLRERWPDRLAAHAEWEPVAEPSAYYDWLRPHASSLDVWETEYLQVLQGEDAVLEWVKGTALVPVRSTLDAFDYAEFTARYGQRLRQAYPRRADGATLLPFRRLFMVARAG
jgi:trans-aconitate methyltransferase